MNGFHFYATYNNNITKVKLLINEKREKEKIEKDLKNETY